MTDLQTEFLYTVIIDIGDVLDLRGTPHGHWCIFPTTRGTFVGPKLKGEVLPGGGDWFLRRPDGVCEIDVRNTYRTDDGQLIYIQYRGILDIPLAVVWNRIMEGAEVEPSEYYSRVTPYFETGSEKYAWLNRIVAVGIGKLEAHWVSHKVYAIL